MLRHVGWTRARNYRSWCSDFVSPSLGTLAHHSTIPVLQDGAPEERLEASDLEAQEYRGQALALLHLLDACGCCDVIGPWPHGPAMISQSRNEFISQVSFRRTHLVNRQVLHLRPARIAGVGKHVVECLLVVLPRK